MIERKITAVITRYLSKYPIVTLTGPRQSGKSTLLRAVLKNYTYLTLEDLDTRRFAIEDPRGFLEHYNDKTIIDEAQYAPELFSYIQTATDLRNKTGQYVLSGSQNFLLLKNIKQSLAGRVSIAKLLPFSYPELADSGIEIGLNELIFKGGYPRIYDKNIPPSEFYENYLQTYINRDVDELLNVRDITSFNKFIKLCAARIGQLLDITSLARDCGISFKTATSWLSILESSYIMFELPPYYANIGKRLIKSPKIYFYDTGLACYLLGMKSTTDLADNKLYGQLFENFVIAEQLKRYYNRKVVPDLYFWRDTNGNEIDLVDDTGPELQLTEIKSGKTAKADFTTNLKTIGQELGVPPKNQRVIYNGKTLTVSGVSFKSWTVD
jgi:predicted AAA+ superfamily ATPase